MNLLDQIRYELLCGKTWRYLRYLHFRDSFQKVASNVSSVCICGAGHGLAELAVALEFPATTFYVSDIVGKGYPNFYKTMQYVFVHEVRNVRFGIWDVCKPLPRTFDMVASTEMLEHIEDVELATRNMILSADKYLYCLVPFSDRKTNDSPSKRRRAWEKNEHHVFGYSAEQLKSFFGAPVHIAGAYWAEHGMRFRSHITGMSNAEIRSSFDNLTRSAESDLLDAVPNSIEEALELKILARKGAVDERTISLPPRLRDILGE